MFTNKTYVLVCHGCGKWHTIESGFLSSPSASSFPANGGRTYCVPNMGCAECQALDVPREEHPIYLGWKNGMTLAAKARAMAELPAWVPVLEFLHPKDCRSINPIALASLIETAKGGTK